MFLADASLGKAAPKAFVVSRPVWPVKPSQAKSNQVKASPAVLEKKIIFFNNSLPVSEAFGSLRKAPGGIILIAPICAYLHPFAAICAFFLEKKDCLFFVSHFPKPAPVEPRLRLGLRQSSLCALYDTVAHLFQGKNQPMSTYAKPCQHPPGGGWGYNPLWMGSAQTRI